MSGEQTAGIEAHQKRLFWGCFIALIATAFGFVVRSMVINDWGTEFGLTETQKGEIFGVGLWPFAISIILFSLVIDRIGYGKTMAFAFVCHVVSAILTIFATGYWMLYIATFIVALGNGAVEAVINPVVATMFRNEKTKWLNILHAGWPGGMVIGGRLRSA
jgi:MFS family permease